VSYEKPRYLNLELYCCGPDCPYFRSYYDPNGPDIYECHALGCRTLCSQNNYDKWLERQENGFPDDCPLSREKGVEVI
jgi:hypothetical protein